MENARLHKFPWRLSYCMREIVLKNEVDEVHRLELAPGLGWFHFAGIAASQPELDIVRVQDLEIAGSDDDTVLAWAAHAERILLTYDQRTVPKYACERIRRGKAVVGVVVVKYTLPLRSAIEDILLIAEATAMADWVDQIQRLPL